MVEMAEKNRSWNCVICGREFTGWGNNPDPVADHGQCCDDCNAMYVIPARLRMIDESKNADKSMTDKRYSHA